MSQFELLNNIPGVEDLTNENAETISGGRFGGAIRGLQRIGRAITTAMRNDKSFGAWTHQFSRDFLRQFAPGGRHRLY